jgi:hypothetical protein
MPLVMEKRASFCGNSRHRLHEGSIVVAYVPVVREVHIYGEPARRATLARQGVEAIEASKHPASTSRPRRGTCGSTTAAESTGRSTRGVRTSSSLGRSRCAITWFAVEVLALGSDRLHTPRMIVSTRGMQYNMAIDTDAQGRPLGRCALCAPIHGRRSFLR